MKIVFKPRHGQTVFDCIKEHTLVKENVSNLAEYILSKDFVLIEKFKGKENVSYNRDWLRYEETVADDRVGFIKAYDVFAGAEEDLETKEVTIHDPAWFIGTIALVADGWSVDKYFKNIADTLMG